MTSLSAASIRIGDRGRREKRAFDLNVMDILGVRNAGFHLRSFHCGGDFSDFRQRADFLRREITRDRHAKGKPSFHAPSLKEPA